MFGTNTRYIILSNIHVSLDMRGQGIGQELFSLAKKWAKSNGAGKLYISAHSEEKEPCDCQLECTL